MDYFVPTPDQLGILLRSLRKEQGMTQSEAARGAGLLPKTVSLLENDPGRSSVGSLFKLLSFLKREVHILEKPGDENQSILKGEW